MNRRPKRAQENSRPLLYLPLFLTESLLPYRSGPTVFTRKYQNTHITVQGGAEDNRHLPLPSGLVARRLLYHLITESWISNNPEIEIQGTQTLLKNLNIKISHPNKKNLKRQVYFLSQMTIRVKDYIGIEHESYRAKTIPIVDEIEQYEVNHPEQLTLFRSFFRFSEQFFGLLQELKEHHPPVSKEALWSLSGPFQSDLYCWLQRRLQHDSAFNEPTISWNALYGQFGRGERLADFKVMLRKNMPKVNAALETRNNREGLSSNPPAQLVKDGLKLTFIPQQVRSKGSQKRKYSF